jgi:hypothetical protein
MIKFLREWRAHGSLVLASGSYTHNFLWKGAASGRKCSPRAALSQVKGFKAKKAAARREGKIKARAGMFFFVFGNLHTHMAAVGMARWMSTDLFAGKHQRSRLLIAEKQRMIKKSEREHRRAEQNTRRAKSATRQIGNVHTKFVKLCVGPTFYWFCSFLQAVSNWVETVQSFILCGAETGSSGLNRSLLTAFEFLQRMRSPIVLKEATLIN